MVFPEGDLSVIQVQCPTCYKLRTYKNQEFLKPERSAERILGALKERVRRLEKELVELKSAYAQLKKKRRKSKIVDIEYVWWLKGNFRMGDVLIVLGKDGTLYRITPPGKQHPNRTPTESTKYNLEQRVLNIDHPYPLYACFGSETDGRESGCQC